MTFNEYQQAARKTAIYPDQGKNFVYPALGLAGETGEVCEKLKKVIRDNNGVITDEVREKLRMELGDCCWYIANLAAELGLAFGDIAEANIAKLKSRQERGVLKGSGDAR